MTDEFGGSGRSYGATNVSAVVVKTSAALAAELPVADHLDHQAGRLVSGLVGVGVEGVADRLGDVEPDEVEHGQRPHRVAGSESHAGVDLTGLHPGSLEHPHGVEEVGGEKPGD